MAESPDATDLSQKPRAEAVASPAPSVTPPDGGAAPTAPKVAEKPAWTERDYDFVAEGWNNARRAALYDYYFGDRLDRVQRSNLGMEIVIAGTASGSVISGWTLWSTAIGGLAWGGLGAVAAIIAIVKPLIRLDLTIEKSSKLLTEYRAIGGSFENLIFSIQQADEITDEHRERFRQLSERMQAAKAIWPARMEQAKIDTFQQKVLKDKPANTLWAPKVPGKHPAVLAPRTGT